MNQLVERLNLMADEMVVDEEACADILTEAATAITDLEALVGELGEALGRTVRFIETLADNDLDEPIADNGMTVGNKLQYDAPALVAATRATLAKLEKARG